MSVPYAQVEKRKDTSEVHPGQTYPKFSGLINQWQMVHHLKMTTSQDKVISTVSWWVHYEQVWSWPVLKQSFFPP